MSEKKTLKALEDALQPFVEKYHTLLSEAVETVLVQDVSNYPILVVHRVAEGFVVGINVINHSETAAEWSMNLSTLEEFVAKRLILSEKIDDFRALYKKHQSDFCLFVIQEDGNTNFVFLPQ